MSLSYTPAPHDPSEAEWEQWTLEWLAEPCGWEPVRGRELAPRPDGTGERPAWDELILTSRLSAAVARINPQLPPEAVDEVVAEFRRRTSPDAFTERFRIHQLLTHGVKVTYPDPATGVERTHTAWAVDFIDPYANDFLAANQVRVKDLVSGRSRRFDIVGYVNGLPLALVELKKAGSGDDSRTAHGQLATYVREFGAGALAVPAVTVASDGITARVGTLFTPWEHMAPWDVDEYGRPVDFNAPETPLALETLIAGVFDPVRFLDLVAGFTSYSRERGGAVDTVRLAKAHQVFAVNKALDRTITAVGSDGRIGVVWHTQGSGKSKEMEFYAAKAMSDPRLRNPTIVLLTDRLDLDSQLFTTFAASELLPEAPAKAETIGELRQLLERPSGGIIFTTLQKFTRTREEREAGLAHPVLTDRRNVIVVVDEAHRSHYDVLDGYARHLRDALPHAAFIAFTGTPVATAEANTRAVFGDYIDVYDLTRAVRDGATVRVYYEPRLVPVKLPRNVNPDDLDDRAEDLTTDLDEEARKRARRAFAAYEDVVGAPERLDRLASDIVEHWERRREAMAKVIGGPGKGMIVGMSRRVCADLYAAIVRLRPEWHSGDDAEGVIKVVYTGSASDQQPVADHVRSPGAVRAIQRRAVDADDKLELVIVQSLWLTGFDSPPLHTLYLDKPMKGAALMQALARVNRRLGEKPSGLIVDYLGIADRLTSALAEYTSTDQAERPIGEDVSAAVDLVHEQHDKLCALLHGCEWRRRRDSGRRRAFVEAALDAVNHLIRPEPDLAEGQPTRADRFSGEARKLVRALTLCPTAPGLDPIRPDLEFFEAVRGYLAKRKADERAALGLPTSVDIELAIRQLTASAVAADGVVDLYEAAGIEKPDLSHLDEEFIRKLRENSRPELAVEALRRAVEREIRAVNPHNVVRQEGFSEKLIRTMNRYTNGGLTAAAVIAELVKLAREVSADRGRAAELGLTEDELAFYDAVAQNESAVSELGTDVLADIARDLVTQIRASVTVDWSVREQAQAAIRSKVKRLLVRYGYPPDAAPAAVELVLRQTTTFADEWSD